MKKITVIALMLAIVFIGLYLVINHVNAAPERIKAYVVGSDRKITVVDLATGKVLAVSDMITGLGHPAGIDINPKNQQLYIASDRRGYGQNAYDPLVVVDLTHDESGQQFNVIKRFIVEPYFNLKDDPQKQKPLQNAVYWVHVSPDGRFLHVGDAAAPEEKLITVLNSQTGQIVDRIDLAIRPKYHVSPKGDQVASIWPASSKKVMQNGEEVIKHYKGGVAIGDLAKGQWVSTIELENNRGLQPPWQKITEPFIFLKNPERQLEVYDRDSGKMLSTFNLITLTGLQPVQTDPLILAGAKRIALPMIDSEQQGYVVVIDVKKQQIIFKIKVGKSPTNVVLA